MTNPNDQSEALRITRQLLNQLGADGARINVQVDNANVQISIPLSLVRKPSGGGAVARGSVSLRLETHKDKNSWGLLTDHFPNNLEELYIISSGDSVFPCIWSTYNPGPADHLTSFKFKYFGSNATVSLGQHLLEFLEGCPKLEVLFLRYCDPKKVILFETSSETTEPIRLGCLRSFTHESDSDTVPMGLFNRLSLEPTCNVTFTIKNPPNKSWGCNFPDLRDTSHLSGIRITVRPETEGCDSLLIVGATFSNLNHVFSVNVAIFSRNYTPAARIKNILGFLEKCKAVETLDFDRCIYEEDKKKVLSLVKKIVVKRQGQGTPLKSVILGVKSKELFEKQNRKLIAELREVVSVEVKGPGGESECSTLVDSSTEKELIYP